MQYYIERKRNRKRVSNLNIFLLFSNMIHHSINADTNIFVGLLTALFRGTNLVPSDVMAGCILLRVRQKREIHELRKLNLIARPKYTSGIVIYEVAKKCKIHLYNVRHLRSIC